MGSVEEAGDIILRFGNKLGGGEMDVFQASTTAISGAAKAAPSGATLTAIPETFKGMLASQMVRCKGRITAYWSAYAADTIESEESQAEIPCLIFKAGTNQVIGQKVLTFENMTGFTAAGTVDVVNVVGLPLRLAYYDVEDGVEYALNPSGKVRVYIGDDT